MILAAKKQFYIPRSVFKPGILLKNFFKIYFIVILLYFRNKMKMHTRVTHIHMTDMTYTRLNTRDMWHPPVRGLNRGKASWFCKMGGGAGRREASREMGWWAREGTGAVTGRARGFGAIVSFLCAEGGGWRKGCVLCCDCWVFAKIIGEGRGGEDKYYCWQVRGSQCCHL